MAVHAQLSKRLIRGALVTASLCGICSPAFAALDEATRTALDSAIAGEHRSAENRARDSYRKPLQTLEFLDFRQDMTVVEVWPGGGWYTEILAPALKANGKLYAAQFSANGEYGFLRKTLGKFMTTLGTMPGVYSQVEITTLYPPYELQIAPRGTADMVLTFRNVHNWVGDLFGKGRYADLYFQAMYDALKPGGTLGVVDHRWHDSENEDPRSGNGYISTSRTIKLAEAAGFKFVEQSALLRNEKDTHEHPRGVWTLPPSLALGDQDREKYEAIGESDRFLLKFHRPAAK